MAQQNNISVVIPENVLAECLGYANSINQLLAPFLHGLDEDDRRELYKLGDKSVGYFQKLRGYMDTAPQHIPSHMNAEEFRKDAGVVLGLQPLYQVLSPLVRKVEDTRMLAGSEAMTEGMSYYGTVALAAKAAAPGAQAIYNDLSERFPGRRGKKISEESPVAKG